jgi:cytoskeletal protein CcmA (bactofilin family)
MQSRLSIILIGAIVLATLPLIANATDDDRIETITRDVSLQSGLEAASIKSFSGAITLGQGSRVSGDVLTEFGELRLERGAEVNGDLENDTGAITLAAGTRIRGSIKTTAGDIDIGPDSHVEGGILVRERGVIGLSLGPLKLGFPLRREKPRVVIGPGATVGGTLRFKQEVQLYVSERATIGAVEGATPVLFAGDLPGE